MTVALCEEQSPFRPGLLHPGRAVLVKRFIIASLCLLLVGPAQADDRKNVAAAAPTHTLPAPEMLLLLIRSTIMALDHANKTGNYTVLREIGGPGLQAMTPEQLARIFERLRAERIDLAPSAVITPELVEQPSIGSDGQLRLVGNFPTEPLRIEFQLVFEAVDGSWKPHGLSVSMTPAKATVAAPPAAQGTPKGPATKSTSAKTGKPEQNAK